MPWSSHSCIDRRYSYSQEIFAIDVLTALKSSLEQRRKHVLRLLRLYRDLAKEKTHAYILEKIKKATFQWTNF